MLNNNSKHTVLSFNSIEDDLNVELEVEYKDGLVTLNVNE